MRKAVGILFLILLLLFILLATYPTAAIGDKGIAEIKELDEKSFEPNEEIKFEAVNHGDDILYLWNFGDGSDISYGRNVTHNYSKTGEYNITLTCITPNGSWDNDTIKVTVEIKEISYIDRIIDCIILVFLMVIIPFSIVLIIALIIRFLIYKKTNVKWEMKTLVMCTLLVVNLGIYLMVVLLNLYSLLFGEGWYFPIGLHLILNTLIGIPLWIFIGFLSILMIPIFTRYVLLKMPILRDRLCIVQKPLPIPIISNKNQSIISKKGFLDFVTGFVLLPLFFIFFTVTITAEGGSPGEFLTDKTLLIGMGPPLVTFIIVPIQILLDSNIIFVKKTERRGIKIIPLGVYPLKFFAQVLGIGALIAFFKIFLSFDLGFNIEEFLNAIFTFYLVFFGIYPSIFFVAFVYSLRHNKYVKSVNDKLDQINLPTYEINEHSKDKRSLTVLPMKGDILKCPNCNKRIKVKELRTKKE